MFRKKKMKLAAEIDAACTATIEAGMCRASECPMFIPCLKAGREGWPQASSGILREAKERLEAAR